MNNTRTQLLLGLTDSYQVQIRVKVHHELRSVTWKLDSKKDLEILVGEISEAMENSGVSRVVFDEHEPLT